MDIIRKTLVLVIYLASWSSKLKIVSASYTVSRYFKWSGCWCRVVGMVRYDSQQDFSTTQKYYTSGYYRVPIRLCVRELVYEFNNIMWEHGYELYFF